MSELSAAGVSEWYSCAIPRKDLKALMKRNDRIAVLWLGAHLACLIGTGVLAYFTLWTWWAIPAFLLYGIIHGFLECPVHEMHHGTPFRSRRLNETLHTILAYMIMKEPIYDRWAHTFHHSYTAMPGDAEIELPRPTSLPKLIRNFLAVDFMRTAPIIPIKHAFGIIGAETRRIVPEVEHRKMIWSSRLFVAIYAAIFAWSLIAWTIVPLLYTVLARFYGRGLGMYFVGLTQHAGMADNVTDHRLNTRTFISNPVIRFFYWNMNYHLEHHMYPLVPFHALPRLHAAIREQTPAPYTGVLACWREMMRTFLRQQREPGYVVQRAVP